MSAEGRSITIEEAEAGRQKLVVSGLREKNPDLYGRALQCVIDQKRAFAAMTALRLEVASAVTPYQVVDVMDELDRESNALLAKRKEDPTLAQAEQASKRKN